MLGVMVCGGTQLIPNDLYAEAFAVSTDNGVLCVRIASANPEKVEIYAYEKNLSGSFCPLYLAFIHSKI